VQVFSNYLDLRFLAASRQSLPYWIYGRIAVTRQLFQMLRQASRILEAFL
jgi:hypothetical protein